MLCSFLEVEIDKGIFDFMTDEVIRDMIPDVDLRYRFKLKYDEYKSKLVAPVEKQFQEPPQPETDPLKTSDQMDDLMDIEEALFLDTEKISSEDSNIQENQNFAYVSYDSNFQSCSNQSDDGKQENIRHFMFISLNLYSFFLFVSQETQAKNRQLR